MSDSNSSVMLIVEDKESWDALQDYLLNHGWKWINGITRVEYENLIWHNTIGAAAFCLDPSDPRGGTIANTTEFNDYKYKDRLKLTIKAQQIPSFLTIAGHDISEVSPEKAKVGCATVTYKEVIKLKEIMERARK